MLLLAFKKWFFHLWDNLLTVMVMNVVFAASLAIVFFVPGLVFASSPLFAWIVRAVGIVIVVWLSGALSHLLGASLQGKALLRRDYRDAIARSFFPSVSLTLVSTALYFFVVAVGTYYSESSDVFGPAGVVLAAWLVLFYLLLVQSYWPLNVQIERRLGTLWKKCYIVFIDNLGYSFLLVAVFLTLTVVSVATSGLFPGFAGVLLFLQAAFSLRVKKYDWIETLAEGVPRRPVPWREILKDDRERLGKRTLKSLIFPWLD